MTRQPTPRAAADGIGRRRALHLMAAATALASIAGCKDESEADRLVPAVIAPEGVVPGVPQRFATASLNAGYASGVVVTHRMGRPIKVEGNPLHPSSLGATDAIAQAEVLGFYDPARAWQITERAAPSDRHRLAAALNGLRAAMARTHGRGLRILTGTTTSPSLAAQLVALRHTLPEARWHQWEAISRDAPRAGARLAYGRPVEAVAKPEAADILLALDSDLLEGAPGAVRMARDVAARRNPTRTRAMSRIYAAEPSPTLIGSMADHRIAADPAALHRIVATLADTVLRGTVPDAAPAWLRDAIADLTAHPGRALVHAGAALPAEAHALVHAVNEALKGRGATYEILEPIEPEPVDQAASLHDLLADMRAGAVRALLVLDCNPAFTAPAALEFADALRRVPFSLAMAAMPNETTALARWAVPQRHPYEAWADARGHDGTATILQPQARPLHGGHSLHELLAALTDPSPPDSPAILREHWRDRLSDTAWRNALADGIVPGTAASPSNARLHPAAATTALPPTPSGDLSLGFRPDPHLWDGRHADNPWLLELPRPLTKVAWDNPLLISPSLARREGLANGDMVRLAVADRAAELPVWVLPGQAETHLTATLGFGRRIAGAAGQGAGFDLFPLTGLGAPPSLRKLGRRITLACTDRGDPWAGEDAARHASLAAFRENPALFAPKPEAPALYRRRPPGPAEWAMSIDLNACIGCNACMVACQAENNVPVVGREQVIAQREMHWLRIDRHYAGTEAEPRAIFQPMLCQHCEQAPCETVCPVGATLHDSEGLNVMVYNRCVGTRFCSNNCPYKVRRFNYHAYAAEEPRPIASRNPEVTVRARGVMEKCSFCLQRIAAARIAADRENRPVGAEEVRTACQAACPAQAISFGNVAVAGAEVQARRDSLLSYAALADQRTHPRVTYEARIHNPRPERRKT